MPSPKPVPLSPPTVMPVVVRTIAAGRGSRALGCPACHSPLNLVQPDESEPTRLLGICESCAKWAFLVELEADWRKAMLVELPDGASLQRIQTDPEDATPDPDSF